MLNVSESVNTLPVESRPDSNREAFTMEVQLMRTTAWKMLCLRDDRGTIIGWIPFPLVADCFGPGCETVYLARPAMTPAATASRAA